MGSFTDTFYDRLTDSKEVLTYRLALGQSEQRLASTAPVRRLEKEIIGTATIPHPGTPKHELDDAQEEA